MIEQHLTNWNHPRDDESILYSPDGSHRIFNKEGKLHLQESHVFMVVGMTSWRTVFSGSVEAMIPILKSFGYINTCGQAC